MLLWILLIPFHFAITHTTLTLHVADGDINKLSESQLITMEVHLLAQLFIIAEVFWSYGFFGLSVLSVVLTLSVLLVRFEFTRSVAISHYLPHGNFVIYFFLARFIIKHVLPLLIILIASIFF
jgi:hypothetical protein